MPLRVYMPLLATEPRERIEQFHNLVQSHAAQLGFHHKSQLNDQLKANEKRASVFFAELDGELVGYTACGSRQYYAHLMRMGDIAVSEKHRRKRIGTALYTAVFATAILEGRRQLEDTIIYSLSPFMADGFCPSLGLQQTGILPKRTSGFRDIYLMTVDVTLEWLREVLARKSKDTTIELVNHESAQSSFTQQMKEYEKHPEVVGELERCHDLVKRQFTVGDLKAAKEGFFGAST